MHLLHGAKKHKKKGYQCFSFCSQFQASLSPFHHAENEILSYLDTKIVYFGHLSAELLPFPFYRQFAIFLLIYFGQGCMDYKGPYTLGQNI